MTIVLDDNEFLKPDIFGLQQDVIICLAEIAELMGKARDLLGKENALDNSSANYGQYQQEIYDARKNVEQLELRMAVVAPMKAGKSTIINAIIGQELLPSRNAAMTTLPTEIVFKRDLAEPCLIISDEVRQTFQSAIESIRQEIKGLGKEAIREKISQYPHLVELIQDIEANQFQIPSNNLSGQERITEVLTSFNDIVRLCSVINPLQDPLAYLTEVIRLETPYLHAEDDRQQEKLGNLVIIDTPGPNEAGENLRLTMVVEDQLKNSAVVLIVLDFTQLNNEAADKVKKQVQPIVDLIGKDNLYVLVNKVDQRRKGDMTTEQVKEFVYADLSLGESAHTDKVFEISAIRAFSAARFMLERQESKNVNPDDKAITLSSAESLAQEVLGIDWEEELEEITVEELHHKAQRLWNNKSGFPPFLAQSINALMSTIAPKLIGSSLTKAKNRLTAMKENINLRSNAIDKDEKKLQQEIDYLEKSLKNLELRQAKFIKVNSIQKELKTELDQILDNLKKDASISIEDYFKEEQNTRKNPSASTQNLILFPGTSPSSSLSIPRISYEPFGLASWLREMFGEKSPKTIEFETKEKASEFANKSTLWAKQRAESVLFSTRQYVDKKISEALVNMKRFLDKQTTPILEDARNHLNQEFGVELVLPDLPSWDGASISKIVFQDIEQSNRKVKVKKSDRKRRFYVLWTFKITHTWEVEVDQQYYCVSLESLTNSINESVTQAFNRLNTEIDEYLNEYFEEKIKEYFDCLDEYLRRYQDSLKQSQQDQKLSYDQKKQLMNDLDKLIPLISRSANKIEILLTRTNQILSN